MVRSKAPIRLEIQPGRGPGVFNLVVGSKDGPLTYGLMQDFIRPVVNQLPSFFDPAVLQKDKIQQGCCLDKPLPGKENIVSEGASIWYKGQDYTIRGLPAAHIKALCCQERYVGQIDLGRYNDNTRKYNMRQWADKFGVTVLPRGF